MKKLFLKGEMDWIEFCLSNKKVNNVENFYIKLLGPRCEEIKMKPESYPCIIVYQLEFVGMHEKPYMTHYEFIYPEDFEISKPNRYEISYPG